jgi:hypothetical protein
MKAQQDLILSHAFGLLTIVRTVFPRTNTLAYLRKRAMDRCTTLTPRRHDTQQNDIWHNDNQIKGLLCDTQH